MERPIGVRSAVGLELTADDMSDFISSGHDDWASFVCDSTLMSLARSPTAVEEAEEPGTAVMRVVPWLQPSDPWWLWGEDGR